ncbi:acyl-CoA dehydrogenase family protein [Saccharothrix violaceirubra]|uniref:Alkylation response protein AidB-like acyl-CoA dehydrogenase n=1 Tax=Saccharothrix violaceirubra TaxID=413306 RepID=A0A7W7T352_9PSEU|nr:acyl-CoA dehydrogenase family protein [Saccharothrix violaceirubra]MBB4964485.1 alkylation response protein AidB-like acyl-CoA dehydrogenase [Saccharothrix violaceirubra]
MGELFETIRTGAAEADRVGRLPDTVVNALVEAGVTRRLAPARFGGGQLDLPAWVAEIEALSAADGSAGWTAMTTSATSALAWYLPEETADEVFSPPDAVVAGTAAPRGTLTGDRVTGRWGWGSAVDWCTWVVGGISTPEGPRLALFPRADVIVHETWDVAGLRGTASHEWEVVDAFVPADRRVWPPSLHVEAPLPSFPFFSFLAMGVASVCLGIAGRALDEVESTDGLLDLATADARLAAARAFLRAEVDERWASALTGGESTLRQRARLRLACSHAAHEAVSVTRSAFEVAGGSAVFSSSPLQRCLRDVHVAAQHAMVSRRLFETYARVRLDLPVDTGRL